MDVSNRKLYKSIGRTRLAAWKQEHLGVLTVVVLQGLKRLSRGQGTKKWPRVWFNSRVRPGINP